MDHHFIHHYRPWKLNQKRRELERKYAQAKPYWAKPENKNEKTK